MSDFARSMRHLQRTAGDSLEQMFEVSADILALAEWPEEEETHERYPTPAETQAWLDEIWTSDPALWEYLMLYDEDNYPAEIDALEERLFLIEDCDE